MMGDFGEDENGIVTVALGPHQETQRYIDVSDGVPLSRGKERDFPLPPPPPSERVNLAEASITLELRRESPEEVFLREEGKPSWLCRLGLHFFRPKGGFLRVWLDKSGALHGYTYKVKFCSLCAKHVWRKDGEFSSRGNQVWTGKIIPVHDKWYTIVSDSRY